MRREGANDMRRSQRPYGVANRIERDVPTSTTRSEAPSPLVSSTSGESMAAPSDKPTWIAEADLTSRPAISMCSGFPIRV